jgi:hypothetical protein
MDNRSGTAEAGGNCRFFFNSVELTAPLCIVHTSLSSGHLVEIIDIFRKPDANIL